MSRETRMRRGNQRPEFGRMHTRPSPSIHTVPWALPREGTGDIRHPTARERGHARSDNPGHVWHNPYRTVVFQDHRDDRGEPEYIPVRNNLPEPAPYVWRSPGWQRRAARFLDLAAITAADKELNRQYRRRRAAA